MTSLSTIMSTRIRDDDRLAYVPRPIIDAVCKVFAEEIAESTCSSMTTFELSEELETCAHCGQIMTRLEAVQSETGEYLCRPCYGPAASDTEPHASPEPLEPPTTT